jgi:AraC family transcriptional regulator
MTQPKVSHGHSHGAVTVGDYRLTEARYAPGQTVERHEHARSSWTFVLTGSLEEAFTRETHTCVAGSVLTKPATASHSNRYGPAGARCLIIEMLRAEEAPPEVALFAAPKIFVGGVVPRIARTIHREFNMPDRLSNFALEGLLIELSVASCRLMRSDRRVSSKRWLNAVRDQLEAEFRSPPSLSDLAAAQNLHPVYVCHEFRAAFGESIGEYARSLRFEWARECLRRGSESISSIALAAGFSDQAHFSRDFKARSGTSPGRYKSGVLVTSSEEKGDAAPRSLGE